MTTTHDQILALLASARADLDTKNTTEAAAREAATREEKIADWEAIEAAGPVSPELRVLALAWIAGDSNTFFSRPIATRAEVAEWLAYSDDLSPGTSSAFIIDYRYLSSGTHCSFRPKCIEGVESDPRTSTEYARRATLAKELTAKSDERRKLEQELAEAKREASQEARLATMDLVVRRLGDLDDQLAWTEKILTHKRPVELLTNALRAVGGLDDTEVVLGPNEKIADVERVSAAAYRALRTLRDSLRERENAVSFALTDADGKTHSVERTIELERVRYTFEDASDCLATTTCYSALVKHDVGGIVVSSRYRLA